MPLREILAVLSDYRRAQVESSLYNLRRFGRAAHDGGGLWRALGAPFVRYAKGNRNAAT